MHLFCKGNLSWGVGLHTLKGPIQPNLRSDSMKAYMLKVKGINNIKACKSKMPIYQSERHHLSIGP